MDGSVGAAIPIPGVGRVALLAMQIGMDPRSSRTFVLLRRFVGFGPVVLGIPPQARQRRIEFRGRSVALQRITELVERHGEKSSTSRGRSSGKFLLQLIEPVESGDLERLLQCGIVEDGVAKILDGTSERQNGLPDVYDLGGTVSDDVDAEKLQACRIEDQ